MTADPMPPTGIEPRGCTTLGACSCVAPDGSEPARLAVADVRKQIVALAERMLVLVSERDNARRQISELETELSHLRHSGRAFSED